MLTANDGWSCGVFTWEVFTLGHVPCPGEPMDRGFALKLRKGFRLDNPDYATDGIFLKMQECWGQEPSARPSFSNLVLSRSAKPLLMRRFLRIVDMGLFLYFIKARPNWIPEEPTSVDLA